MRKLRDRAAAEMVEHKAITLLREWMETELDPQDEDYDQWMQSFTDRVNDVLIAAGAKE